MGYSDYKYYKPTIWDKLTIEGCMWGFVILLLAGIWINDFRWKLIFTSMFLFLIAIIQVKVLETKEEKARTERKVNDVVRIIKSKGNK